MAENRGGMRPTAPQNNPANVSGTGGAGQNGNYTGFAYGENKEINQNRIEGNQAVSSVKASTPAPEGPAYGGMNFPQLGTLMDPSTRPEEPITAGVDFGPGPGLEALPADFQNNTRPDENTVIAKQYLPELVIAARSQNAPDSFKRFVNYLIAEAQR
jgi:hypothetical protein